MRRKTILLVSLIGFIGLLFGCGLRVKEESSNSKQKVEEKTTDKPKQIEESFLKPYNIKKNPEKASQPSPEQQVGEKIKDTADPKAKELLLQVFKKMKEPKGYHFEGKIITTASSPDEGSETGECIINGIYLIPDYYVKMQMSFINDKERTRGLEMYVINKKVVARQDNDEWEQRPFDSSKVSNLNIVDHILTKFANNTEKENFLGKEILGDKSCQTIICSLTGVGLKDFMGEGAPFDDTFPIDEMTTTIINPLLKIWICEKDLLIYKCIFSNTVIFRFKNEEKDAQLEKWEMSVRNNAQFNISDYDKDTEFKIPTEVKKLLEKKEKKD